VGLRRRAGRAGRPGRRADRAHALRGAAARQLGTIDTQPGGTAADFYQNDPTNQYAKIIHASMVDGKAYAFAFDDVQNQESLVHDGNPQSAGITMSPF
jgi:hypothetical protein